MDTRTTYKKALALPQVTTSMRERLEEYINSAKVLTKKEGNPEHVNVFFLPYNKEEGMIYLGYHKKADDWIPPGGHIEPGETPSEAAIREMKEELNYTITTDSLELWNLSYKVINRPKSGCLTHYDIWYLVHLPASIDFVYDPGEYHDAAWFSIRKGVSKISKNPDFATIIKRLATN